MQEEGEQNGNDVCLQYPYKRNGQPPGNTQWYDSGSCSLWCCCRGLAFCDERLAQRFLQQLFRLYHVPIPDLYEPQRWRWRGVPILEPAQLLVVAHFTAESSQSLDMPTGDNFRKAPLSKSTPVLLPGGMKPAGLRTEPISVTLCRSIFP